MHKTRLGHCKIIYGALPAHGRTVVGQDLDEIFEIADRIAVISRGERCPRRTRRTPSTASASAC